MLDSLAGLSQVSKRRICDDCLYVCSVYCSCCSCCYLTVGTQAPYMPSTTGRAVPNRKYSDESKVAISVQKVGGVRRCGDIARRKASALAYNNIPPQAQSIICSVDWISCRWLVAGGLIKTNPQKPFFLGKRGLERVPLTSRRSYPIA